jgi:hypothetical protein
MLFDRREFIRLSAASLLFANDSQEALSEAAVAISQDDGSVRVKATNYSWEWSQDSDIFRLSDGRGRLITTGPLQPAVVVSDGGVTASRSTSGRFSSKSLNGSSLSITYAGVNGHATLASVWRFEASNLWLETFVYSTPVKEDVISLHYFAKAGDQTPIPALEQSFLVQPGISESTAISPILPALSHLDLTSWLGHGDTQGELQQWGLPVHFFCGASNLPGFNTKDSLTELLSDSFCCGLAELPAADLLLHIEGGNCSPVLNIRSDLWGQSRGPGSLSLGSPFYWALGRDYRESIRQYYLGLVRAGRIKIKSNSPQKNAVVTAPAFDTWGEETAADKTQSKFDEALLVSTYEGLKASGMRPGTFIIDQKWEGSYGLLQHAEDRFPHFDQFLERLRKDGYRLGMWAAFIRCDDPAAVGLKVDHMLRNVDGKPITKQEKNRDYYLYDFTQPEVERVLRERVKTFVSRYKPDLVKFDFGYELPSLSYGAPKNMEWAGERLLMKGVALIVDAIHEINPDVVVMYYSLSPLFINHFDLHSPDDLFLCGEDYQIEANRRFFFSGLLGEIGMPTFSSSGYDWLSVRDIWFDAAAIGSIASLNSFSGDEQASGPTPLRVAKYNGLSQITRSTNVFKVEALDPVLLGSTSGAHSSSWVRLEGGEPTLVALRAFGLDGRRGPGHYQDLVKSDASFVLSSKSDLGIRSSRQLGVVPYGDGEAVVLHDGTEAKATITTHCLGKDPRTESLPIRDGLLHVPLREQLEDGSVVEWLQIEFS